MRRPRCLRMRRLRRVSRRRRNGQTLLKSSRVFVWRTAKAKMTSSSGLHDNNAGILFLGLLVLGSVIWAIWRSTKRRHADKIRVSVAWPIYKARVVCAQVVVAVEGDDGVPVYWEGLLTYSYIVPGHELEVGEFRRSFFDKFSADRWAQALNNTYVDVRVDPEDVKCSVGSNPRIFLKMK